MAVRRLAAMLLLFGAPAFGSPLYSTNPQAGPWLLALAGFLVSLGLCARAVIHRRERARLLIALDRARRAVEIANRHEASFLANISHEIRTPMHAIIGMAGLALEDSVSEKQRAHLLHVQKSSQSLLALLNEIADYSELEAGNLELKTTNFHLHDRLQMELRTWELRAREECLNLTLELAPGIPEYVVGDARRIGQILSNLVGNAIKFSIAGEIRVRVNLAAQPDDTADLEFVVADTGIGVPPEKQQAIFGAFEQADGSMTRKHGGAGLGLAVCTRLVHLMHGRIWVESPWIAPQTGDEVAGSAFHFIVRVKPGERPVVQPLKMPLRPARNLRILLAEDNPVNQQLVLHILRRRGHTVAIANNGVEAVEIAKRQAMDIILMDVQMPEMDGFQATAAIRDWERGRSCSLCIVALTAHAMDGDRERCLSQGFDLYLAKPFHPDELDHVLAQGAARTPSALAG